MPTPDLFLRTARAYQDSAAVKTAIDLDMFTAMGEGAASASEIGRRCSASERGIRILCDFLVVLGFLTKSADKYSMTPDTATFLDRRSPMCIASAANWLCNTQAMGTFEYLIESVRKGGSTMPDGGSTSHENPLWIQFAEAMAPMMTMVAGVVAQALGEAAAKAKKALDIAAGHGMYGIMLAQRNPGLRMAAVDWPQVLEVAKRNAQKFGVAERYATLAGSAFDVDFGADYDIILVPNFLHHFSAERNIEFLKKVRAALAPGGRAAIVEFVPNDDRVSPPWAASFSLTMLTSTPEGDAFTFRELEQMCRGGGFTNVTIQALLPAPQSLIIAEK
jgi:SAM-dependent methyltransferase